MATSRWDRRSPRFMGCLYAIIIRLMLHFSLFLGFSDVSGALSIGVLLCVLDRLLGYERMLDHWDETVGGG